MVDTNTRPLRPIYAVHFISKNSRFIFIFRIILDAIMTYEDNNRLKYVFQGPPKDSGKKLYYIYGTKSSDVDSGLEKTNYKPQGKGYNWPQSYRKANNLYYDVTFLQKGLFFNFICYSFFCSAFFCWACLNAVGKIAKKAVCRSVFLTTHSFRLFFGVFAHWEVFGLFCVYLNLCFAFEKLNK